MFFSILTYVFIVLLTITALFYAVLEFRWFRALGTVRVGKSIRQPPPSVSVLIAARNEEKSIQKTLDGVLQQDYQGYWDVWVADDRSTDRTSEILAEYKTEYPEKIHVITIENVLKGQSAKKNAISKMIAACESEILLLTDADCTVQPTWISGMIREFEPGIELVVGNSYLELPPHSHSALLMMQAIEVLSYRIAGTAGLAMNTPITSTGNNLAYRRSLFMDVKGFEGVSHILSGDDDLLVQKIANHFPWKARYCIAPETFVKTTGKETFKELWEQRKRWASKTIYYSPRIVFLLSMVFTFLMTLCIGSILSFLSWKIFLATVIAFIIKVIGDMFVIIRGLRIFNQQQLLKWFFPVEFIHAPFIVLAVLFGTAGKFQWKP
jgi:cellulose synthase/poly-beta-1,6-N-acetylglucosamine synthase-like glycosyltransferase